MQEKPSLPIVGKLMTEFARQTGLSPVGQFPRRYLWTDAFAVCNFLGLFHRTADNRYKSLALSLVAQVHATLGRHRHDDRRQGWISGLAEAEGRLHPTAGGLRIGKKLNERGPAEPFAENLEWDRDGQYYHYLTKWMQALNCLSIALQEPLYHTWARELARAIHSRFVYAPVAGAQKRMYWKMSIDLSRPLVASMGHHDPLDGLLTYSALQANRQSAAPDLTEEVNDLAAICRGKNWETDDPLGIGGLLCAALQAAQLTAQGFLAGSDLLRAILAAALAGLDYFTRSGALLLPAAYRLAFREFGLAIGLHAIDKLQSLLAGRREAFTNYDSLHALVEQCARHLPLMEAIEAFWLDDAHRESVPWKEHEEINMVMLATSLAPHDFLDCFSDRR